MKLGLRHLFTQEWELLRASANTRRFILAVTFFDLGYWIHLTAFPILTYLLTGKASAVAYVMVAHGSAALLLILFGKSVFRSATRIEVCRRACLALAAASGAVFLLFPLDAAGRLYPYVALFSLLNQFHSSASFSMIPSMAGDPKRNKTLNSIRSMAFIVASLIGPLLVSLLVHFKTLGIYPILVTALASGACVLYTALPRASPVPLGAPNPAAPTRVSQDPVIGFHILIWFLFSLSLAFDPMMVVFVREFLIQPEVYVGLILALCSLASILGSALINTFEHSESLPFLAAYYLVTGLSLGLFSICQRLTLSMFVVVLVGLGYGLLYTAFHTRLQSVVDDASLSRAYISIQAAQVAGGLVSVLASKALLSLLPINGIYAAYGMAFLAGSAYIYSCAPRTAR